MPTRPLSQGPVEARSASSAHECIGLSRSGFTLVEILIALAIVVAIGALMLPVLSRGGSTSSREDITQVLDSAVAQAMVRSARTGSLAAITLSPAGEDRVDVLVCDIDSTAQGEPASRDGAGSSSESRTVPREEVVGAFKMGATARSVSTGTDGGQKGTESEDPTTLALIAPDGTVQPMRRGVIRVGREAEIHTVRVDGFGIVHLEVSTADGSAGGDGTSPADQSGPRSGAGTSGGLSASAEGEEDR
ncbi:MAG: type II secretion system protein [Phycisphaerales bacterium]|nr:type II secretion system protein [Phycisphaerales bacterium]